MNPQQTIESGSVGSPNISADGRPPGSGGRHRGGFEQSTNRAVGAAIVAGGLAFSASLYPLPGESDLLELFPPNDESSELANGDGRLDSRLVDSTLVNQELPDLSMLELRDLLPLVELLNHNFPNLPANALLDLVKTYGLPDVVKSLELLNSFEPLTHSFLVPLGGGGGGSPGLPPNVLQALAILLEFLQQNLPPSSGQGLSDVLTSALPTFVQSYGIHPTSTAPPPEAPVLAPTDAAASVVAEAPEFTPPEAPTFAPTEAAVAPLAEAPVIAPTEVPVIAPTEPASALPEAPDLTPDLPNVDLPEPDPPTPDTQSPEGGTDAGAASGSDAGSSSGSDGGSSGGSDGGSSGGSDGGSSGGE